MKAIARIALIFSVCYALFLLLPPFLDNPFGPFPLMKTADFFDLFTPFVLIPLYLLMFEVHKEHEPTRLELMAFLLLAILWVSGQAMHLAGNSIGHFVSAGTAKDLAVLTDFYDEKLSHYMWHAAMIGMSVLIVFRQMKYPFGGERPMLGFTIPAGIIYGFASFLVFIEGATTPMSVPLTVLAGIYAWIVGRHQFRQVPLVLVFFIAFLVTTLFMLGWGIYWGGLPEPSKVGII